MRLIERMFSTSFQDGGDVMHRLSTFAVALLLVGCGSGSTPAATDPPAPAPVVTAAPAWSLSTGTMQYTKRLSLGDTIDFSVEITNSGTSANATTRLIIDGLSDKADLIGCVPACATGLFSSIDLPGVAARSTATYKMQFQTKKLGVAHWTVCVYDPDTRVGCGEAVTTISG